LEGLVEAPEEVGVGTAVVALSFDAWAAGRVAPAVVEVPIVAPKAGPQLESVSKRLLGELIHPGKAGTVHGVRYSPDGRRIVGMDDATHAIVVWAVASGRAVTNINTRRDGRVTGDYFVTPDYETVFAAGTRRDYEPLEQNGKQLIRWSFDGDVRAWDVATGQLRRTYQHQPPRNVQAIQLSRDGAKFVAFEEVPGTYEGRPKQVAGIWDVRTGEYRPLPDGLQSYGGQFSPDGRTFVVGAGGEDGYTKAIKLIDLCTGKERRSIHIPDPHAHVFLSDLSPDGKIVVGHFRAFAEANKFDTIRTSWKWWDVADGHEVASFAAQKNDDFSGARFSPDGRTIAASHWQGDQTTMRLYRTDEKRLDRTIVLGPKTSEGPLLVRERVFSPDSKWLAVIAQRFPDNLGRDPDPRDLPQPRIHLIEVATGEVRETLVAPQSLMWSAAFSPDGRTLATGGHGKVLLWDVSKVTARR
jgi:WD40 repeat protein